MIEDIDFKKLENMILDEIDNPFEVVVAATKKYKVKETEEKEKNPLELAKPKDIFKESIYEAIVEKKEKRGKNSKK